MLTPQYLLPLADEIDSATAAAPSVEPVAPAPTVPAGWRDAVARLVAGFEHVSGIARQWEPDHSSGADRARWARATEACADVARLLAAAPQAQPAAVPLTEEQIVAIGRMQKWMPWGIGSRCSDAVGFAQACIAEFCRVNGITPQEGA